MSTSSGIFRFANRLPPTAQRVTLGEGDTPIVRLDRLGATIGLPNLVAKLESVNPTGSYKDRIAAMSISHALSSGKRGWIATSSGNAGSALAAYGARAGLPGFLTVVPNIPREKLLPALAMGATVVSIEGVGQGGSAGVETALFETVQSIAAEHDLLLGVTAHRYNPLGMRGADTIAYEIAESGLEPDAVYVPTGGGGLVSAIARGTAASGLSSPVVAAQPDGCGPIAAYINGALAEPRIEASATRVSGLQLPSPPDGRIAAELVLESGGWGAMASDDAIAEARDLLATTEGVFVEAAAATALAAAMADQRGGRLAPTAVVLLILTGSGLKDLATVDGRVSLRSCPLGDLRRAVEEWLQSA